MKLKRSSIFLSPELFWAILEPMLAGILTLNTVPFMAIHLLVLHGPNLNLLGRREVEVYGTITLDEINQRLLQRAQAAHAMLDIFQSNEEGGLINRIHRACEEAVEFVIINPAGFTHTSVALRDALAGVDIPFVEVHLSNIYRREDFRQRSFFSDLAQGVICGFGWRGYLLALEFAIAWEPLNGSA